MYAVSATACNSQLFKRDTNTAVVFASDSVHNFNHISRAKNDTVSYTFILKNTGKRNLILNKVDPACHCTKVSYTKQPVKPGGEAKITVYYDVLNSFNGFFKKSVKVTCNIPTGPKTLIIKGVVED